MKKGTNTLGSPYEHLKCGAADLKDTIKITLSE